jgi:nucleotidyltransferase AbiEii toxin of type IV toxin-antitoxin system
VIAAAFITHWRTVVPWGADHQVEHDLILARVLVEIFSDPDLGRSLAFRGGTAIHKLLLPTPLRYSDDLDLVQITPGPIGELMKALRQRLDPLLGASQFARGRIGHAAVYRFDSEIPPTQPLRLKIEINTREHQSVLGFQPRRLTVESPWFSGAADVLTYHPDELYATKLRALYQREKGRDLFDLAIGLEHGLLDPDAVIRCCLEYLKAGKTPINRRQFADNLKAKIRRPAFRGDIVPLLGPGTAYDPDAAYTLVTRAFIDRWPLK